MTRLSKILSSLHDFFTVQRRSDHQERQFRVSIIKVLTPVLQFFLLVTLLALTVGWLTTGMVYSGDYLQVVNQWIVFSGGAYLLLLTLITVSQEARKRINLLFTITFAFISIISGYSLLFLDEPHSAGMYTIYSMPFWSIPLPASLKQRISITP